MLNPEEEILFNPHIEIKHYHLNLERQSKGGVKAFPVLNILAWQENGVFFSHCGELDIIGEGKSLQESFRSLAELVIMQIEFAESKKTELYHPAPRQFWQKLHEIQANEIKQTLLSNPPKNVDDVLKGIEPAYA